jgi:hypothetical protein
MTDERVTLIELVEKQVDGDLVRKMLAFAAERILERSPPRQLRSLVSIRMGRGGWGTRAVSALTDERPARPTLPNGSKYPAA